MKTSTLDLLKTRPLRQRLMSLVVIITIGLGWKYPWIAYSVPMVMAANIFSLFLKRGRIVCGNFCPRGSFFDRILRPISGGRATPSFFRKDAFRWGVVAVLFGFFIFQVTTTPFTFKSIGYIFWMMCTVTTIIGMTLGLFFSHRTWCSFCPVGTIISNLGQNNDQLTIDKNTCISCKLCERTCPMDIEILKDRESGLLSHKDCIKCGECISRCPKKSLG